MTASARSLLFSEPCYGLSLLLDDEMFVVAYLIGACQEAALHTVPVSFVFGSS